MSNGIRIHKNIKVLLLSTAAAAVLITAAAVVFSISAPVSLADEQKIMPGYKQTSALQRSDMSDRYQKNYMKSAGSADDSYLYKSAEWIDINKGTARITIKGKANRQATAVYAFTTCTAHGFKKEICRANIDYLLRYYDTVDLIAINGPDLSGIKTISGVTSETAGKALEECTWGGGRHWTSLIYQGLTEYLMGSLGSNRQQRYPACIYVSMDGYGYPLLDTRAYNASTWKVLSEYRQQGRYYSSVNDNEILISCSQKTDMASAVLTGNTVAGLYDPAIFPGTDATSFYNSESVTQGGSLYSMPCSGDHLYQDSFGEDGYDPLQNDTGSVTDTVSSGFSIADIRTDAKNADIDVNGNSVKVCSISGNSLSRGFTVTIDIKAKNGADALQHDRWIDTNAGSAYFKTAAYGKELSVPSPRLCIPDAAETGKNVSAIRVSPVWDDNNDAAGRRPSHVTVRLMYRDGGYAGREVVLSSGSGWTAKFKGLDRDISEYMIYQSGIEGYKTKYSLLGDEYTIVNTYDQ